jgi:hypothetical protein
MVDISYREAIIRVSGKQEEKSMRVLVAINHNIDTPVDALAGVYADEEALFKGFQSMYQNTYVRIEWASEAKAELVGFDGDDDPGDALAYVFHVTVNT